MHKHLVARQHTKILATCFESSMHNTTESTSLEFQELRRQPKKSADITTMIKLAWSMVALEFCLKFFKK